MTLKIRKISIVLVFYNFFLFLRGSFRIRGVRANLRKVLNKSLFNEVTKIIMVFRCGQTGRYPIECDSWDLR